MKTFTVENDCDLKTFTDCVFPQGAFCLAALLRARDVKVNGVRVGKGGFALKTGDIVAYYTNFKQESAPSHTVIYQDENALIADKFSGVSVEGLTCELREKGDYRPCHRLDRNTQGLLAFAKNDGAEREILSAFKERRVEKEYIALCKNNFKEKSAVLTAFLVKDDKKSLVKVFAKPVAGGVKIVTEYEVLRVSGDIALVRVKLHTGKTHQIRAHTAFIGCPVLGDEKYGEKALNAKYNAKRQRLISKSLKFEFTGGLAYLNGKEFKSNFDFDEI